ncbi:MAG: hypothetical protein IKG46_13145 [Solobacterium sp.]|nr:hypothetical protein [Solobacterium sp.]
MKLCVIIPYFGTFNSYFHLWKQSCGNNRDIDWLLFTDQILDDLPVNMKYVYMTFSDMKKRLEDKFDKKACLNRPYKLCDYKPYYGYIFSEYLTEYDFWGYCDCDVIFGDILSFLTDDIFSEYDKLLRTGHLCFVRNKKEISENFFRYPTYKTVIHSPVIYGYDESVKGFHLGFAGELLESGYRFYNDSSKIADIDFRHFPFYIIGNDKTPVSFIYKKGKLYCLKNIDGQNKLEEMMYLHLQKRKMEVKTNSLDEIIIYPNTIDTLQNTVPDDSFWEKISKESDVYYSGKAERKDSIKRDILRFLYEPRKISSIVYRIRRRIKL